jgi:hypothetical protein
MALMVAGALVVNVSIAASQPPTPRPLTANDLWILFPPPGNAKDLNNLIALSNLNGFSGTGRVWSDADFSQFLAIAENPKAQIAGTSFPLRLPAEVKRISAWFILASARLTSMVIMGLAFPEPWIFIAMQKVPVGGGQFTFVPVPGPTLDGAQAAQMLNFRGGPQVVPAPVTINQNPITCRHAAFQKPPQPRSEHKGVPRRNLSTAVLRTTASGRSLTSSPTPRRVTSSIPTASAVTRIRPSRCFGSATTSPSTASPGRCCRKAFLNMGPAVPTATRRTATETAEVVEFINRELLGK